MQSQLTRPNGLARNTRLQAASVWQRGAAARFGAAAAATTTATAPATATIASAKAELLAAIQGTERGLDTPPAARSRIMATVDALAAAAAASSKNNQRTVDRASGTWKLLWTTEKETLWILKNAGLFGTAAGDVFQVIDVDNGRLQNVIEFPPEGAFIVDSGIAVAGAQRIRFRFSSAKLKLPSRDVTLPPFGQGWFDTVYVDDAIRVAKDVRGDTLVVARDGPPRVFG